MDFMPRACGACDLSDAPVCRSPSLRYVESVARIGPPARNKEANAFHVPRVDRAADQAVHAFCTARLAENRRAIEGPSIAALGPGARQDRPAGHRAAGF